MQEALKRNVPILNSILYFPWRCHKEGLKKLLFLWLLTSAPIILSVINSEVPSGDESFWLKLLAKLSNGISVSDLFVYSASFFSPLLYIMFEKLDFSGKGSIERTIRQSAKIFKGYLLIWFLCAILLGLTAIGFSTESSDSENKNTFLHILLMDWYVYIYLFAILCFYLSILDGLNITEDYVRSKREDEKEFIDQFQNRLSKGS